MHEREREMEKESDWLSTCIIYLLMLLSGTPIPILVSLKSNFGAFMLIAFFFVSVYHDLPKGQNLNRKRNCCWSHDGIVIQQLFCNTLKF